jgi:group I intron endonuclease
VTKRSGLYRIICIATGKGYVGSTVDWRARKYRHLRDLRLGIHPNRHLQNAFTKYGEGAFEMVWLRDAHPDELASIEQVLLSESGSEFNVSKDTISPRRGLKNSEAMKRKIATALLGHVVSVSTRDKIRKALQGKPLSEETRRKLSRARLGYRLSVDAKLRIGIAARGRNVGEKSGVSKLTDHQRRDIAGRCLRGESRHILAKEYGVDESTIRRVFRLQKEMANNGN